MNCLDVGCGGGDVTAEIAQLVGSTGHVLGVDLDRDKLVIARREAREKRLNNIEYQNLDVNTLSFDSRFDLVYSRFLLTHLKNPHEIAQKILRSARLDGIIVIEDIDFSGYFCYPSYPAFDQYLAYYRQSVEKRGGDPDIGRKLPVMLQESGLAEIQIHIVQPVFLSGESKLMTSITMENIADAVISDRLATRAEIDEVIQKLREFSKNPKTLISFPRIFQVWGRRK